MENKYLDKNRELAVSFNLRLPYNVYKYAISLQNAARKVTSDLRKYDTSPHLAIATKFMPFILSEQYTNCIRENFLENKKFEIEFDSFKIAETNNYIFLEPTMESKKYILELRKAALEKSKGIGFETPMNQPALFQYDPHISIIKCPSDKIEAILKEINNDLISISGIVEVLFVSREKRRSDGFGDFPEILTIDLK
jgi:hypothetical protein